jgi:hypothetical protein
MNTPTEIKILLRRKIPYVSEGLWGIFAVFALILFLFYLFMLPAKNASDEMATAYYILVIPMVKAVICNCTYWNSYFWAIVLCRKIKKTCCIDN